MEFTKLERQVLSSDSRHTLFGTVYLPENKPRACVQVIHGMTDFTERYEFLFSSLAAAGYLVFGFDQLGHGKTGDVEGDFGFFAKENGWLYLLKDIAVTYQAITKEFGVYPHILIGHSMGSFIARCAALGYVKPEKLILTGTMASHPLSDEGINLSDLVVKIKGERYVSPWLQKIVFGSYDKRFPGDYSHRWVCVDTENLKRYADNSYCTFSFTASAMRDLIYLQKRANSSAFFSQIEGKILLLSGGDDPLGDYGKGIKKIEKKLSRRGKDVKVKLYEGFRHEILQDFCKEEVVEDILCFLEEQEDPA